MLTHPADGHTNRLTTARTPEEFWRGRFPAPVQLVWLPVDRPRPPAPSYVRETADYTLPATAAVGLRSLSAGFDVPALAVLLAAVQTVLVRYSRQESFVLGAVAPAGRRPEASHLPLWPVPVQSAMFRETSGQELIRRVSRELDEIKAHAAYPLQELQALAGVSDPAFGRRLFNVVLSLVAADDPSDEESMSDPAVSGCLAQCDVSLTARWTNTAVSLCADFDADIFDKPTIERLLGHVGIVLDGILSDPSVPVLRLPMLTPAERQTLLIGWNAGRQSIPRFHTLHKWFEAQAERTPEAVALICDGDSLTYGELNHRANRLAHALQEQGVGPNILVGLCLERSLELVIGLLGILKAGGAYLPIDLSYPADRLAFMLEDAQARFLVTQSKLAANLPIHQARLICIDNAELSEFRAFPVTNPASRAKAESLAYVIYTSGTTGKSKGALIRHENVTRLFTATEAWFGFNESDVWTLFHSTAFDFSVWELWGGLLYGGRVVIVPFLVSRSPESFYDLLRREQVTVLNQTPSAFRQLIHAEEGAEQTNLALRYVIFGGEALELQSLRPWFERHGDKKPQLVNMYGITETTVHVTYRPLCKDDLESGSVIGVPIPDLQIYILDEFRQPVPIGVAGEMYVGGRGLAEGYLRRPELTSERFITNRFTETGDLRLYKTGDLARFLPGKDIEYLGRIDHQVKIRGFRIELGEIESVLCQHTAVREAVVTVREDAPGVKTLAAYVVPSSPAPQVSMLREHLKKQLPDHMVPAAFVLLEKLPLTSNGKVDRAALPAPDPSHRTEMTDRYVAPRTPFEQKLADIWSKVLRAERIGVHDNFFELGGDSILSIQAISMARRDGLMVTPKQMFAHQTIAELAAVITVQQESKAQSDQANGDVPLTPIQHWLFEQHLDETQHYNQALLVEVSERLDCTTLRQAVHEVARHHDALRLRYVRERGSWRQFYGEQDASVPFSWSDLSGLDDTEQRRLIEEQAAFTQASLNLEHGPLWRVVYFDLGTDRPGRLLVVVHHLAVDGISWRPLMEDLETAYQQLHAGDCIRLPAKTASFKAWAEDVQKFANSEALWAEISHWRAVTTSSPIAVANQGTECGPDTAGNEENTEVKASTVKVMLSVAETEALLHAVPSAYNTQINDVLLTALARAWNRWTGGSALLASLEGHGREQLIRELDLSRTVGWFTAVFPVRLEVPNLDRSWDPGAALKSVKEQLRKTPHRGVGYGALRYFRQDSGLAGLAEPPIVFNYFGQFDQLLSGSKLFSFASESTGPWHSPRQRRRYALEVNAMVINRRLELSWTYSSARYSEGSMNCLTSEFMTALKEVIVHCQLPSAVGRTPSDFPLVQIDQPALDRLVAGRRTIEDIYPLSPIQSLFLSVNPGPAITEFDQWHTKLLGCLNVAAFQGAWQETLRRHSILRSTIHGEGLNQPLQVVHRDVRSPWSVQDWRGMSSIEQAERWAAFLTEDRKTPLTLTQEPVMRFVLVQLTEDAWEFLWSVPALLLDGWSWPVVFREASEIYGALSRGQRITLDPALPYKAYIEWLGSQSTKDAEAFWRDNLKGFRHPTKWPSGVPAVTDANDRFAEHAVVLSVKATGALNAVARRLQLTVSSLVQGAWALLLSRQSGLSDIVFGAAFAGRPVELRGADSIVGPFVNNVPVRVQVDGECRTAKFFRDVHARILGLSPFQYMPLLEIQDCSEVPWQYRLFESLVVFQNYAVDEAARCFGGDIHLAEFRAPIHTNYPVLLLAEPGDALKLVLIYDRKYMARTVVEAWGQDLSLLMSQLPAVLDWPLRELKERLSAPVEGGGPLRTRMHVGSQNYVPPQTELEKSIAMVWQRMFGLERVSVEENLFDLGGHSLLIVHMHRRLATALKREFPLVTLFMCPTIRALARHFEEADQPAQKTDDQWRTRAQQQKAALTQLRNKRGTR